MTSSPTALLRQLIRKNRRSRAVGLLARASEKFLRAFHNEGFYEFERNGEAFAMDCFARWRGDKPTILWDVGANEGQWARTAHDRLPESRVHSFEILPPIAEKYATQLAASGWAVLHQIGLSDREGETQVTWNQDCDTTSSITIRDDIEWGGRLKSVSCPVSTIDRQIASGVPAPDLLKIDTEGHDAAILRGAHELLTSDKAPAMIQFEYGSTWIPAGETLEQTQKLLETAGYSVGRLHPDHVNFKRYSYQDEHYRMGNMIAAKTASLIDALKG